MVGEVKADFKYAFNGMSVEIGNVDKEEASKLIRTISGVKDGTINHYYQ